MIATPAQRASKAGFTLVEVLIASVLLVIGLVGSISLMIGLLRGNQTTRARDNAYFLAQEMLDQFASVPIAGVPNHPLLNGAIGSAPSAPLCYALGEDSFFDHPIPCLGAAAYYVRAEACCAEPGGGGAFTNANPPLAPALVACPNPPAVFPNNGKTGAWCQIQVEVTWPSELGVAAAALFASPPASPLTFQNHILESMVRSQ